MRTSPHPRVNLFTDKLVLCPPQKWSERDKRTVLIFGDVGHAQVVWQYRMLRHSRRTVELRRRSSSMQ